MKNAEINKAKFFNRYADIESKCIIKNRIVSADCLYTFLIPAYRNPKCLRRALNSIYGQIDCPDYLVLVVDDSGEEIPGIKEVVLEFIDKGNISLYRNEKRLGLFGNWNRCYELARTKYCCFLNHDDELEPNYLNRVNTVLNDENFDSLHVGNTIYRGGVITSQKGINRKYFNRPGHIQRPKFSYFLYRGGFPPSGTCIKREIVYRLGGYDEKYYPAGDYEFDARLTKNYKVGILWERLCNIYTDESTSFEEETIKESINIGYRLNLHVYNDIFKMNGKYDWIAAIRYWTSLNGSKFNSDIKVEERYSHIFYTMMYRIFVNYKRIIEYIER